jgi:hypothetical protein
MKQYYINLYKSGTKDNKKVFGTVLELTHVLPQKRTTGFGNSFS